MKNEVKSTTKQVMEQMTKKKEDVKAATNVGDIVTGVVGTVGSVANKALDTAAAITDVAIGNSTNEEKIEENMKSMKEKFNLNQSFKVKENKSVANDISNALSSENLAKCASDAAAKNEMDINKVTVKGDIDISDIAQEALIDDVMKCAFNQEVATEIATKIVSNYDNLIQQMIENVDSKLSDEQISKIQGDIYAAGVAGAAVLQAAGEATSTAAKGLGEGVSTAAKGAGEGLSTAAKGMGEGIGTAAKGVGEGVANVAKGLTGMLIPAAIIGVIGLVVFMFRKKLMRMLTSGVDDTPALPSAVPVPPNMYQMPGMMPQMQMPGMMPQYGAPMQGMMQPQFPQQFGAPLPDALSATPTA
jgi:hypothetical protein